MIQTLLILLSYGGILCSYRNRTYLTEIFISFTKMSFSVPHILLPDLQDFPRTLHQLSRLGCHKQMSYLAVTTRWSNLMSLEVKFHSEKLIEQRWSKLFKLLAYTQLAELISLYCGIAKLQEYVIKCYYLPHQNGCNFQSCK